MKAYEIFKSGTESPHDGLSRDRAQTLLRRHDDFPADQADTEYAIERLLDYGWLYEVEGELRITDSES
ncbi:hypothetical protein [Haloarcula sp. JP-L23]|uniref:hypothetical protein n=1 Tax=Haloarcula sp. JP-L23 TaxID=2716717 RepID=UPI001D04CE18